jgi:hypothetical protein
VIEEIFHVLSSLGDLHSNTITSILAKDFRVKYYDDWFDRNPKGLCLLDLYILKLALYGREIDKTLIRHTLSLLRDNFDEISKHMERNLVNMKEFMDPRCAA